MGRQVIVFVAGVLLGVAAWAQLGPWVRGETAPDTRPSVESPTLPVEPLPSPRNAGFVGVILPDEAVDVVARVEGPVERLYVRQGDRVVKGQPIASVNSLNLRDDLAIADAQLAAAQADAQRARLEYEQAQATRERRVALQESRGVSGEELSKAQFEEKSSQARLHQALAAVEERRARANQMKTKLAEAEIRAPFDGAIVARLVDTGAVVQPNTVLARLMKDAHLWVRFAIPVEDSAGIAVGTALRVEASSLAGAATARIDTLAASVNPALGLLIAEARLPVPAEWAGRPISGRAARVWCERQ